MDFGWCVYEGTFINGKAEGSGTMTYDDYTYAGKFKNGMEDGCGVIIYKNGKKENVRYIQGQKVEGPIKLDAEAYKPLNPQDKNCISGDCINGYGTYLWPSGNKYTGNWKDYKREGKGTSTARAGDTFTGTWHNNEKVEGTYKFPNGAVYQGTYTPDGNELNGTITLRDMNIPLVNGVARIPPKPKIVNNNTGNSGKVNSNEGMKRMCNVCKGMGSIHRTIPGGGVSTDRYGNRTTVFGENERCVSCSGKGYN